MAQCNCGATWLWDWCNDCFVNKNGKEYGKASVENEEDVLYIWHCNCGKINGAMSPGLSMNFDGFGLGEDIWEEDEHSYGEL